MASVRTKHLALLFAAPITLIATTGLAQEPHDDHVRPAPYNQPTLPDELAPVPSQAPAEYPLAVTFNPADPSNYTANGIISPDYIVVHTMQGYYYGSQSWFQNPAANVSAHFCMRAEDGEVTQMVKLADRAWHVGNSNPYAIGIEHEGFIDEPAWYTWENYVSSGMLARWLADELDIPRDRNHIVGHVELPNQSHTDPGIHWNWDLYMALINDFVSEGLIVGHVVDRGSACTLTATVDTWIKHTLQQSADLVDTDKCYIPAGTELTYLHASADMAGHRRLRYDAEGHPCEGFINLDEVGFIHTAHYTELCTDASVAAAGVTVILDGGQQTVTDQDGNFSFAAGPGAHTIDVVGGGQYLDTLEPVDVDVFPGARVVIALDPLAGPGDGDGDGDGDGGGEGGNEAGGEGGGEGGACWIGEQDCACTAGQGCDPGLTCEADVCVPNNAGETDGGTGELPGIDYLDAESCACTGANERPRGLLALALLGLVGLRRRPRQ